VSLIATVHPSPTPLPSLVRSVGENTRSPPPSPQCEKAEIEGPEQTPYHTRYFQLKLVLSADFPSTPPRGYFLTKIYHPNVDPTTGAICVNTLKSDWTPSTTLGHVLTVIRCLLIVPFPESSLNDEAGRSFMDSYGEYARRARLLAGVHGLTGWSSGCGGRGGGGGGGGRSPSSGRGGADDKGTTRGGGEDEGDDDDDDDDDNDEDGGGGDRKKKAAANPAGGGVNAKLGKTGSRSNIVRAGSKTLDKKNKKKSLRRL
jgi:ubiquitin-conjugating enzyme E2 S